MILKKYLSVAIALGVAGGFFVASPAQAAVYDNYRDCSPVQEGMVLSISPTMTGSNLNVEVCRKVAEKITYTTGTKNGKKVTVQNVARTFKVVPETQTFVITASQQSATKNSPSRILLNYGGFARISKMSYSLVPGKSDPSCTSYTTNKGQFVAYAGLTPAPSVKCVYVGIGTLSATGQNMTTPEITVTPLPGRIVP